MIMKAEKAYNLLSTSKRPRKASVVIQRPEGKSPQNRFQSGSVDLRTKTEAED